MTKLVNLSEIDCQPVEIQEALAFYVAHTILPVQFTAEERERHYKILEEAGYLESVGA
ncbi:hypothetical protein D3C78_1968200 [compost metagenome]